MKLYIKWRYPDIGHDNETHEHTFYDVNPKKINISYGYLYFEGTENPEEKHWQFALNHIIEMHMEEE